MKFSIDGREFNVFVSELSRSARIEESGYSGDVRSGEHFRDIVGTFYDYDMVVQTDSLNEEDYDDFYELLTAPTESHVIVAPYGRGTLEFEAYIENVSDRLVSKRDEMARWGELDVRFYAKRPQRRPESG